MAPPNNEILFTIYNRDVIKTKPMPRCKMVASGGIWTKFCAFIKDDFNQCFISKF